MLYCSGQWGEREANWRQRFSNNVLSSGIDAFRRARGRARNSENCSNTNCPLFARSADYFLANSLRKADKYYLSLARSAEWARPSSTSPAQEVMQQLRRSLCRCRRRRRRRWRRLAPRNLTKTATRKCHRTTHYNRSDEPVIFLEVFV